MNIKSNYYVSPLLRSKDYLDELEEQDFSNIRAALRKMGTFLSERGISLPAKDVKRQPRIEIKGVDSNGKERLLQQEIKEKLGIDVLEDSKGYNILFPIFKEGVIMCKTEEYGTYYTHFIVREEAAEHFDLEIHEYRFYNQIFYMHYLVYIEGLSKVMPMCETKTRYSGINGFFFTPFSRSDLKDFTDKELDDIRAVTPSEGKDATEVDAITSYTLSTFRVVNFLREYYQENGLSSLVDNEYFEIKNWNDDMDSSTVGEDDSWITTYVEDLIHNDSGVQILNTHTIDSVINEIVKCADINTFYSAVGFAFRSGLKILEPIFHKIHKKDGKCELIIGSLQNHDNEKANNKMDKHTVKYMNELIKKNMMDLYTYKPSFYHGKFYYMSNDKKAFVIVGSSNLSKTAFKVNYEMDVIHIMEKGSKQDQQFLDWYNTLRKQCEKIELLNENNFDEYNWTSELDAYHSLKYQRVSSEEVKKKIEALSDEELKYRLTLWLDKNPTDRYENIGIDALKDYIMFVYAENGLVVFESFIPGNAYYVFRYRNSLVKLLEEIANMSKTQMACSVHYVNRGYHMQSKDKLVQRVNKYFEQY